MDGSWLCQSWNPIPNSLLTIKGPVSWYHQCHRSITSKTMDYFHSSMNMCLCSLLTLVELLLTTLLHGELVRLWHHCMQWNAILPCNTKITSCLHHVQCTLYNTRTYWSQKSKLGACLCFTGLIGPLVNSSQASWRLVCMPLVLEQLIDYSTIDEAQWWTTL